MWPALILLVAVDSPGPLSAAAAVLTQRHGFHINVEDPAEPRGGRLEVRYPPGPVRARPLLEELVRAYNLAFPDRYHVAQSGDVYSLVPDAPLLDRRITFPAKRRNAYETFREISLALTRAAGVRVDCTTGVVWNGLMQSTLEIGAANEPARDVLLRALRSLHWRCSWDARRSPSTGEWMINLIPVERLGPGAKQTSIPWNPPVPPPPPAPPPPQ